MKNRPDKRLESVRKAIVDPVLFARRILGVELSEQQIEILHSIRHNRKTAVKACNAAGKTFTLAVAARCGGWPAIRMASSLRPRLLIARLKRRYGP
jgi:hypothetical protein